MVQNVGAHKNKFTSTHLKILHQVVGFLAYYPWTPDGLKRGFRPKKFNSPQTHFQVVIILADHSLIQPTEYRTSRVICNAWLADALETDFDHFFPLSLPMFIKT